MNAADKTVIHFYRKTGCHLCDAMARALDAFMRELDSRDEYAIIERDIEDDPSWHQRYREYVPTLVVGEREVCYYFFDSDELKHALREESCKQ
ncbi:MAG: glutaredoxin family protein [Gammaproteobacteria bacterium]|nr:glutaredoxin family protein [Gammaproteobacteria bacterium]MDD9885083.1 glutaredoxin family protein [Gammaproteobacteria bacterium]